MFLFRLSILLLAGLVCACGGDGEPSDGDPSDTREDASPPSDAGLPSDGDAPRDTQTDAPDDPDAPPVFYEAVTVEVTLDGAPAPDTTVVQGGVGVHYITGQDGTVLVPIDYNVTGQLALIASHPEARIGSRKLDEVVDGVARIALTRYDASDNPAYTFQDPGEPRRRPTTAQCSHCHQTIGDAWFNSPHRTAASNPYVHDWFSGTTHVAEDEAACAALGGVWLPGRAPGTGAAVERCFIASGALQTLNPGCVGDCVDAVDTGGCADCHAPATTGPAGELGGQSLLDARGFAHEYGVFCDVCHRVDRVVPSSDAPGVGGRLVLTRPSEPSSSSALGRWQPLTFGPSHDSPNARMGSVQRDHYRDGSLCGGCHEHDAPAPPGATLDLARWPSGRLPVQSTYSEWRDGPLGDAAVCNDCHMPPEPLAWNGADLQRAGLSEIGIQGGWIRPPGSVRQHSWLGPRTPSGRMLAHAAALFVDKSVVDGVLTARVTTRNVGAGHAIPTGEPMRALVLLVEATCGEQPLTPVGGDIVPEIGGADLRLEGRAALEAAPLEVGDRVRAVRTTDAWHDYPGWGPFGDGTFSSADKGMPVYDWAGSSTVVALRDDGSPAFEPPLADADTYFVARGSGAHAGAPGFAFARVTVGRDGTMGVPHFEAVDLASDNRLGPQVAYTTTHRFEAACDDPVVRATLVHRRFGYREARARGWSLDDQTMTEVTR